MAFMQQQRPGLGPSFGQQRGMPSGSRFPPPRPQQQMVNQLGGSFGRPQQPQMSPNFGRPMQPQIQQQQPPPAVAESFGQQQNPDMMKNKWMQMLQQMGGQMQQPQMGGGFGQMRQPQPFMRGLGPQQFPIQNQMQRVVRNPVMEEDMQNQMGQMY